MYYLNKIPYDKKLPCRHLAVIQTKLDFRLEQNLVTRRHWHNVNEADLIYTCFLLG